MNYSIHIVFLTKEMKEKHRLYFSNTTINKKFKATVRKAQEIIKHASILQTKIDYRLEYPHVCQD